MARARTLEGAPVATMASSAPREIPPATSAGSLDVNGAMRSKYRSRRCPRWRLRDGSSGCPIRERGAWVPRSTRRAKTLLVDADGGEPFEKMHETKDGIVVWMRASDDKSCAAKEVMAVATFRECTATQFWRAVRDVERYAEFVPFVKTSFAVKKTLSLSTMPNRANESESSHAHDVVWAYNRVKPPVASARDYCIKIVSDIVSDDIADFHDFSSSNVFVASWEVDELEGPRPCKGVVRLRRNRGSWRVADDARGGVAVTYRVLTDPGAGVPGWLVDVANKTSVPDVLRAFAERATSGLYEEEATLKQRDDKARAERGKKAAAGFSL